MFTMFMSPNDQRVVGMLLRRERHFAPADRPKQQPSNIWKQYHVRDKEEDLLPPCVQAEQCPTNQQAWDVRVCATSRHDDPTEIGPDSDRESEQETESLAVSLSESDDKEDAHAQGDARHEPEGQDEVTFATQECD